MQRRTFVLSMILILALAAGLAGCRGGSGADATVPTMQVQVYAVPAAETDRLVDTLNKVFATSTTLSLGKASSPSPGQLVVLAPANLQGSIESSLKTLASDSAATPAVKPDPPIRLSFWNVDAVPETGADDLELASLEGALGEVRKQLGGVRFVLRDQVSAVSGVGSKVSRSWVGTKLTSDSPSPLQTLSYTLQRQGADLMLELNFGDQIPVLHGDAVQYMSVGTDTTTVIRLGQTLVLTQTPIPRSVMSSGDVSLSDRATRLVLVRADAMPAG